MFIVSAGNFPAPSAPIPATSYPEYFEEEAARIVSPAEAMLALTVGSVSRKSNTGSMAAEYSPSPFTRRGPGFANYRKPDVVTNGGNYGAAWRSINDLSAVGINKTGDSIAYNVGTSFSVPLISRACAKLFEQIPNATPELVRGLIVHFSRRKDDALFDSEKLIQLTGNGIPSLDKLNASNNWEQTFYFQGAIDYREMLYIPFQIPKSLVNRKRRNKVEVIVTITGSPETARTLKKGYCKSHLRAKICKLNSKGAHVEVDPDVEFEDDIRERYSTTIRLRKSFSSAILEGEWLLLVEQQSRWRPKDQNTAFAAIITVRDPHSESGIDIFNEVRTEARAGVFSEVKIRERIRF